MAAEVFVEYRRAAHEAFVIEIPLLCTDAVGPNDSVGRCARARGHVHTTGTNLGPDAGWDFLQPGHRQQALRRLQHERPYFVTLAIPAEPWMFSSVALSSRDRHQQQLQALTTSTRFALRIARLQLGGGRHFVIEHPPGSIFWRLPGVRTLISDPRCHGFSIDLGRCGSQTQAHGRARLPVTQLLTSSQAVVCQFRGEAGKVSGVQAGRELKIYPRAFCQRLAAAMEEELTWKPDG